MPDMKIYVGTDDEELVRLHKEKYGREWSKRVVSLIRRDYEGKTEEPEDRPAELTAAELARVDCIITAQFNAAVIDGEKRYLARMKKDDIDVESITKARLKKIEAAEPKLYPAICEQLKNTLPQIAKIGGLTE